MNPRHLPALACACGVVLALVACGHDGPHEDPAAGARSAPQTASLAPMPAARRPAPARSSTAEVVGVMVHAPTAGTTESFEQLGFPGTFSRCRMAIQVRHQPGGLIDLLREESRVEAFGDDRGTDLIDPQDAFGPIEMLPDIAEDGGSLVFIVGSKRSPHATASRLEARGTIVALRASQTAVREVGVAFQQGETFALGPFEFEITEVGESEWSEGWSLELTSKQDLAAILRYALVTDGAEQELQPSMSMSGMGVWKQTLAHEAPLEKGTLRIEYWSDPSKVELPFSVSSGLGLR